VPRLCSIVRSAQSNLTQFRNWFVVACRKILPSEDPLVSALGSDFTESSFRQREKWNDFIAYRRNQHLPKKFRRAFVATGICGFAVCTALLFAVLQPDYSLEKDLRKRGMGNTGFVLASNAGADKRLLTTDSSIVTMPESSSSAACDHPQPTDPISPKDIPLSSPSPAEPLVVSVAAASPEIEHFIPYRIETTRPVKNRRAHRSPTRPMIARGKYKSSGLTGHLLVQKLLVALWHKSLRQSDAHRSE
jgi:hypothetical protein